MLYRPHRGVYDESMAEIVEWNTLEDLQDIVPHKGRIEVKKYCYDERNQWDTYIVTAGGFAVGFTNGELPNG